MNDDQDGLEHQLSDELADDPELLSWPCPEDPTELAGQPIGMYHCPYCGEMQIAGMEHVPPQFAEQWDCDQTRPCTEQEKCWIHRGFDDVNGITFGR